MGSILGKEIRAIKETWSRGWVDNLICSVWSEESYHSHYLRKYPCALLGEFRGWAVPNHCSLLKVVFSSYAEIFWGVCVLYILERRSTAQVALI
jgi:hypothetical protein